MKQVLRNADRCRLDSLSLLKGKPEVIFKLNQGKNPEHGFPAMQQPLATFQIQTANRVVSI